MITVLHLFLVSTFDFSRPSVMLIYGLRPLLENDFDSPCPISLQRIAGQAVTKNIAKAILRQTQDPNTQTRNLWMDNDWQLFREDLHHDVPRSLLDEIYERDVSGSGHRISRSQPCTHCLDIKDYDDKELTSLHLPRFMLAWILLDIHDYRLTHPDIGHEDVPFLQTFQTGMVSIIINSGEWINQSEPDDSKGELLTGTTEDLEKILKKQVNLSMLTLNFDDIDTPDDADSTGSDSNLLNVFSRSSKLNKIFFTNRRYSWSSNTFEDFMGLIKSQAENLDNLAVFSKMDKEKSKRFWNLLADLPHLTRFTCNSMEFFDLRSLKPLRHLEVLAITELQEFEDFPVDTLFPSLIELKLNLENNMEDELLERVFNRSQVPTRVTTIDCECAFCHPLKWISCLPNATHARIEQFNGFTIMEPFEHIHLQELVFICHIGMRYSDFKMFFQCFPNLCALSLDSSTFRIQGFDENDFVQFLSGPDARCSNLSSLTLSSLTRNLFPMYWVDLTGKSVVAIIQYSKISNLRGFHRTSFSDEDCEALKKVAKSRNLKIIPVDKEGQILFTCENGEHIEIF